MKSYRVLAKVDQIVTKEVILTVSASCEEEAESKARAALMEYPKGTSELGVERILTVKSNYWIPKSIDFSSVKELADG